MPLLFNMLSKLVIAFLSRWKHHGCSHHLQWFWSPKMWSLTVSIVSPSICLEVMGPDAIMLVFWMLSFKLTFSLSSFTVIKLKKKNLTLGNLEMRFGQRDSGSFSSFLPPWLMFTFYLKRSRYLLYKKLLLLISNFILFLWTSSTSSLVLFWKHGLTIQSSCAR